MKRHFSSGKDIPTRQRATFGAGCYWGTEKFIQKDFNSKFPDSNIKGAVGFMGFTGQERENPTYHEVCSGDTGYVEVYDFYFSGENLYELLIKHFFSFHDPTTLNQQGNDRGSQYASVIFFHDEEQAKIAHAVKEELQNLIEVGAVLGFAEPTVKTKIIPASTFYSASENHQAYLAKNPGGYCNHFYRIPSWAQK